MDQDITEGGMMVETDLINHQKVDGTSHENNLSTSNSSSSTSTTFMTADDEGVAEAVAKEDVDHEVIVDAAAGE
eukprot:gene26402-32979_t